MPVVEIQDLYVDFNVRGEWIPAVSGVSMTVEKGRVMAVVGESGSGKTVTCLSIARLLDERTARYPAGKIFVTIDGQIVDVLALPKNRLRAVRGKKVAYIFQEPSVCLNPVFTIGNQILECIDPDTVDDPRKTAAELLYKVGIPDPMARMKCYPHQLSGGMQQRVMIAMALAGNPELLVADEPTTALDITVQAQILDLLAQIKRDAGMAILFITHNLALVAQTADDMVVMYAGRVVEAGLAADVLARPAHPYTKKLIEAVPKLGRKQRLATIAGSVPNPQDYPPGCRFFGRCPMPEAVDIAASRLCAAENPEMKEIAPGRHCRCHHVNSIP